MINKYKHDKKLYIRDGDKYFWMYESSAEKGYAVVALRRMGYLRFGEMGLFVNPPHRKREFGITDGVDLI